MTAVWLWSAGRAEGVAGDRAKACENAASYLSGPGDTAVVEQARFVLLAGEDPLDTGYEKLAGAPQLTACRHPDGQVRWKARPAGSELAAS